MAKNPFAIDLYALDKECQKQPQLVSDYSRVLAEAKKALADKEKEYKLFREKLASRVRQYPGKYKIMKVTNDAVMSAVSNHEKVAEFLEAISDLTYAVDMAWADVHAVNSKQTSLSDLVRLHGQAYFDTIATTREGVESIRKDAARHKGGVRKK
jgi:vacuolar-type H+-ATPase subunit I/STV1